MDDDTAEADEERRAQATNKKTRGQAQTRSTVFSSASLHKTRVPKRQECRCSQLQGKRRVREGMESKPRQVRWRESFARRTRDKKMKRRRRARKDAKMQRSKGKGANAALVLRMPHSHATNRVPRAGARNVNTTRLGADAGCPGEDANKKGMGGRGSARDRRQRWAPAWPGQTVLAQVFKSLVSQGFAREFVQEVVEDCLSASKCRRGLLHCAMRPETGRGISNYRARIKSNGGCQNKMKQNGVDG